MKANVYLEQAYRLDQRINSKVSQVASLNELATKVTSVITGMPNNRGASTSSMADTIVKIMELQEEINNDINKLVALKREIVYVIKGVENYELQTLLEKRYLCYLTWEQIAVDMGYCLRSIHMKHNEALKKVVIPKNLG